VIERPRAMRHANTAAGAHRAHHRCLPRSHPLRLPPSDSIPRILPQRAQAVSHPVSFFSLLPSGKHEKTYFIGNGTSVVMGRPIFKTYKTNMMACLGSSSSNTLEGRELLSQTSSYEEIRRATIYFFCILRAPPSRVAGEVRDETFAAQRQPIDAIVLCPNAGLGDLYLRRYP
jgi:hypothetical protein